jgi:hypothetical protein
MSAGIKRDDIDAGAIIPSKLDATLKRESKTFHIGDIAADSDAIKVPLWNLPHAITIKRIMMGFDTAITAADTNYQTYEITDGTNTIASTVTGPVTGGNSFAAGVLEALTLVAAYVDQAAAQQLYVEFTKEGSGMTGSNCTVQIDFEYDDPS